MSGHGHVTPNPDGSKARCGGPAICSQCAKEVGARYGRLVAAMEQIRSAPHVGTSWRQRYEECVKIANDTLGPDGPRSHNDDCDGCGTPADAARIRGHVAGGFGAMAVADTIRKGGTVEIPSLGITLTKRDLQKDDDQKAD